MRRVAHPARRTVEGAICGKIIGPGQQRTSRNYRSRSAAIGAVRTKSSCSEVVCALGALGAADRRLLQREPLEGRPRMSARRCAPSRDELRLEQGPTRAHRALAKTDFRARVVARGMRRLGRDKLEDSVYRRVHYRHHLRADASVEGRQLRRWVDVNRVRLCPVAG